MVFRRSALFAEMSRFATAHENVDDCDDAKFGDGANLGYVSVIASMGNANFFFWLNLALSIGRVSLGSFDYGKSAAVEKCTSRI